MSCGYKNVSVQHNAGTYFKGIYSLESNPHKSNDGGKRAVRKIKLVLANDDYHFVYDSESKRVNTGV